MREDRDKARGESHQARAGPGREGPSAAQEGGEGSGVIRQRGQHKSLHACTQSYAGTLRFTQLTAPLEARPG